MNKVAILALSVAVSASMLAAPVSSEQIVVSPLDAYVEAVQTDLNQQLERTRFVAVGPQSGMTSVRFRAGQDGRPMDIKTYRKSGSNRIDQFGRHAVARLTSLAPLSYGSKDGQLIQANIIIATSESNLKRLERQLARDEARRLAMAPEEKEVLALATVRHPVS